MQAAGTGGLAAPGAGARERDPGWERDVADALCDLKRAPC